MENYDPDHPFDDQALQHLIPYLNRFSIFDTLDIRGTQVTDDGLFHLEELNCLEEILLDGPQVSDAGLEVLAQMETLKRIDVQGTAVTAEGVARFQGAMPNCEVRWDGD